MTLKGKINSSKMSAKSNLFNFFASFFENTIVVNRFLFSLVFSLLSAVYCYSQSACPSVSVTPTNVSMCSGCTTLTATVQGSVATTSYTLSSIAYSPFSYNTGTAVLVNIDDTWSSVISIPFCFQFYGNTYNQLVIGSNGLITFDLSTANGYCPWALSGTPIPDPSIPMNSIMGPYQDIDPTNMGNIYWQITGTAPCRAFIVSFYQVPYFGDPNSVSTSSCPNPLFATSQIVLYETTNIIDIYIKDKPVCTGWNSGYGIEGIQNSTGTSAVAVAGRNCTVWTATNDAQRFTPSGAPQYSLTWYAPPNTAIGTSPTVSVCPTVSTTYTATVVNTTCSTPITVTAVATVNIGTGSPPTMTFTQSACSSSNGTATATPTSGSAPYTYLWSTTPPQNTQTATGLSAGTYSCIITDATGCSGTSTVTVTSTGGLTATASSTSTNCSANNGTATANPTGGTAPFTYAWSTTPPQNTQTATGLGSGTYTVTVTDANGCSASVTTSVTSPNGITSVNTTATQPNCTGGNNGTATATPAGGTAPYTYLWTGGQTTQTATGLSAGTYSVTTSDANGCTFPTTVTVPQPPAIAYTSSTAADTCGKKIGSANAVPNGGTAPYTYMWLTSPVQTSPTAVALSPGTYTCIITDASGCTVMASATVGNFPGPTANFTANPQVVDILNANVSFIDLSASNITTWQWSFGDGGNSSIQYPNHTYTTEGDFVVTLIVTNSAGCIDSIQQTILVEGYSTFYVPNTFTPNNDGNNDVFMPKFTRIDENGYSMMIFDRWGNEIFKTTKTTEGWNGKVHKTGQVVQEDVYVYVITYLDLHHAQHKVIGNVNLVK